MRHVTEYAPAKTGNFRVILHQFSKDPACYEKYLKKDKLNSLHLTYKNACDVEVHSFPRVKLEEACSLIGIDFTRAFFSRQMEAMVYMCVFAWCFHVICEILKHGDKLFTGELKKLDFAGSKQLRNILFKRSKKAKFTTSWRRTFVSNRKLLPMRKRLVP